MFDWLFGSDNPYEEAMGKYSMQDMQALLNHYYGPYREAGLNMLPTLENQANMLITNPGSVYSSLGAGFETSPGYEYQMQTGMNAANQAASAGGMAGTQQHQGYAQSTAQGIASQEWNTYMDYMMNLYKQGLGLGGDINQMGYKASSSMLDELTRFMGAQMGLSAQAAQYEAEQALNWLPFVGGLAGATAGGILGGAGGASSGWKMGSEMGESLGGSSSGGFMRRR